MLNLNQFKFKSNFEKRSNLRSMSFFVYINGHLIAGSPTKNRLIPVGISIPLNDPEDSRYLTVQS